MAIRILESSLFYAAVTGTIKETGDSLMIELKTKINPVGLCVSVFIALVIGYGQLTEIVLQNNPPPVFLIRRSLVALLIMLIFQTVPFFAYRNSKRRIIKKLITALRLNKKI